MGYLKGILILVFTSVSFFAFTKGTNVIYDTIIQRDTLFLHQGNIKLYSEAVINNEKDFWDVFATVIIK